MKHLLCTTLVILIFSSGFSQQTEIQQQITKEDYLQKSRNQKTAAWIMLGGGAAMSAGAIIWAVDQFWGPDRGQEALFYSGLCVMGGSIPLFIVAAGNKKKANRMVLNMKFERSIVLQQNGFSNTNYPALSFKIKL